MKVQGRGATPLAAFFAIMLLTSMTALPPGRSSTFLAVSTSSGPSHITWSDAYVLVQHHIPGNSAEPWGIAAGPNGDVWFVEQGTNSLGSFDPASGNFSQYPIPTAGSTPSSVAVDEGGNVWFTELTANNLGELPLGASTIREFHVAPSSVSLAGVPQKLDCGPGPVLPDPRGYIWVGCLFSNQVDEFFPGNGTFARFDLPVFNSAPAGLALDGKGDLWFTAADAQMLGEAIISDLKNGTNDGITESAPLNSTYVMTYEHATSFLGSSSNVTSSLPTPSGIAIDASGKLWVTEHVDSSFDSYDPGTRSLVKYWTSQTFGAYGYSVSFPNGIALDGAGTVWIGEHYGNKILSYNQTSGAMVEYPVPCCKGVVAGVYSVAMDKNGSLWFVEIDGSSIGEMVRTSAPFSLGLTLPGTTAAISQAGSLQIPLNYSIPSGGAPESLNLSVSGVSFTGAPGNLTATFSPSVVALSEGVQTRSVLTLRTDGLKPGVYYLTLTAQASPRGDLYSAVLRLTVTGGPTLPLVYVALAVLALTALSVTLAWRFSRRPGRRPRHGGLS